MGYSKRIQGHISGGARGEILDDIPGGISEHIFWWLSKKKRISDEVSERNFESNRMENSTYYVLRGTVRLGIACCGGGYQSHLFTNLWSRLWNVNVFWKNPWRNSERIIEKNLDVRNFLILVYFMKKFLKEIHEFI